MVRIYGSTGLSPNQELVRRFFSGRAASYAADVGEILDEGQVASAMLYGEASDAERRSIEEFSTISEKLPLGPNARVLDVGCGLGRWAGQLWDKVGHYLGVDIVEELVRLAERRFQDANHVQFLLSNDSPVTKPLDGERFDLTLLAGVVHYVGDDEAIQLLQSISEITNGGKVYIRGPFAKRERLLLASEWSPGLNSRYSALYRTVEEFLDLVPQSWVVEHEGLLFAGHSDQQETEQRYWIFNAC